MTRSASETRRSPPLSDGRLRSSPPNAIVEEPPASSAEAVTTPSRAIVCASSKFVIPEE
jgi:hypothetical protein